MNKTECYNTVVAQIEDLSSLTSVQTKNSFELDYIKEILDAEQISKLKKIIIIGCGDSYSAAGAMALAFRELSGLEVDTPDPMEFIHFYTARDLLSFYKNEEVLVIVISASGGGERHRQMLEKANKNGCLSLLLTNNADSSNIASAKYTFNTRTAQGLNSPGLRSYFASMVSLLAIASYIGIVQSKREKNDHAVLEKEIIDYVLSFINDFTRIDDLIFDTAVKYRDLQKFDCVGDGPDLFSAQFVEEKIIECAGLFANHTNSEEWVHISMMLKDPEHILTIIMVNSLSNSINRIKNMVWGSIALKRPTIVVSDEYFNEFEGAVFCPIPKASRSYLSPLINYLPGSLLAGYLAPLNNKLFFNNHYDYRTLTWHREV